MKDWQKTGPNVPFCLNYRPSSECEVVVQISCGCLVSLPPPGGKVAKPDGGDQNKPARWTQSPHQVAAKRHCSSISIHDNPEIPTTLFSVRHNACYQHAVIHPPQ